MTPDPQRLLGSTVFEWSMLPIIPTRAGERRELFDSPTRTFRNLECHATTLNEGERAHDAHRHADEELVIVKEGALEVTINGQTSRAAAGSVVFFASNDLHGMANAYAGRTTYHVIRILTADTPA